MSSPFGVSPFSVPKNRSYLYSIFVGASLICFIYFAGSVLTAKDYNERISRWPMQVISNVQIHKSAVCENRCKPPGSEALPKGIVVQTSDLEMRALWNNSISVEKEKPSLSLLAIPVGIKQKDIVAKMVEKFLSSGFVVLLFHYDGVVDKWSELNWNDHVIHVSAKNQTKWWFAKRFLHPDVVADYDYVFLWDEDLQVENFDPQRYISIIKSEGLEISQPSLDPAKSVIHHPITVRSKKSKVHRRFYKPGRCDWNQNVPPCIGWVEMMAPVFSKAAWQCVWYMIQNVLIHAWGLDRQLGYCAQGDRTKNVGFVDSEYVVHLGRPTLGVFHKKEASESSKVDKRPAVRWQSYIEMREFRQRWKDAVKKDECWVDMYQSVQ